MKGFSKYLKVVLCFMAFALCSFMFAFTPTFTAVQAAEMAITAYNVAINAVRMPIEEVNFEDGDEFNIPLLNASLGSLAPTDYTIRVVDPAGSSHDFVVGDGVTNSDSFFGGTFEATSAQEESLNLIEGNKYLRVNAKNDGEYKILYIVNNGENGQTKRTYYSNTYRVQVSNVSYALEFATAVIKDNGVTAEGDRYEIVGYNKNLIKTKLATSTTDTYVLPVAYAKITGKDLTIDQTTGKVTNDVASVKISFSPQDGNYEGDVYTTEVVDGVTRYSITPKEEGIYTVEYSFDKSSNRPTKTYTIVVEDNYEASELKLASTPTMPNMELGKTVTLPKVTVNAGESKNVDVNITSIKIEKEKSDGAIACVLENNNLEFTLSPENFSGVTSYENMVGNYRVTYTVQDAYGKILTETFKVDGVTVSTKPSIKLSYNFDVTDGIRSDDVVVGAETELQAEYISSTEFVLPAVYIEDVVANKYDNLAKTDVTNENFDVIRTIRKGSNYYYIDNVRYNDNTNTFEAVDPSDKGYNVSGDVNIGNTNKAVKFKFNTGTTNIEGTYYLEYRVVAKQVKERENNLYIDGTSTKYSFKVLTDATALSTYKAPTVEITNLKNSAVKDTEKLTVNVKSVDSLDLRVKTSVFTHTTSTGVTEAGCSSFQDYLELVVDNLLATVGSEKYSHVLDDKRLIDGWTVDNVTFKGLKHYYNDVKRLEETKTKNSFQLDLVNQTNVVKVVAVAMNDGGLISTNTKTLTIKDTDEADVPEMKIYASKFDPNSKWVNSGNIVEFKVGQGKEVILPSVYVYDVVDKTLSLNVMYYIDSPENSYGGIQYLSPTGKNYYYDKVNSQEVQVIDGGKIITSATGIYYVAYTATDDAGNTSVMYFTFEVEDTSKPVLTVTPTSCDEDKKITVTGNTITAFRNTEIDFDSVLKSADNKNDYTANAKITVSVDDNGLGLSQGEYVTSRVFENFGTYTVTVKASYQKDGGSPILDANDKVYTVVIEKQDTEWLGEFDVPEYAEAGTTIRLPDVPASNDAVVKVKYIAPGDSTNEAVDATKVTENGYSFWEFSTASTAKGTYKVIYTATTQDDVKTKELKIKVGDRIAPTLTYNVGELTQKYIYDGTNPIEIILEVSKKNKSFVVKVNNNGKEVISHNIGLVISDTDDSLTGGSVNMSWTNLEYDITGDGVTKGTPSTKDNVTTTSYTINGAGTYTLQFTMEDSYENINDREKIEFKVVTKASVKENNDTVVGAVLIVISLVLLAGVILYFTFTGKKSSTSTKTKSPKTSKVKREIKVEENVETEKISEVEEAQDAVIEGQVQIEDVQQDNNDEDKTGDIE